MHVTRPRSVPELDLLMRRFRSEESRSAGLSLDVRPSDVFIATYPKSGTTWLQQMVHAVRSDCDMDFDEICQVVPWLESAVDMGQDPDADQPWEPRLFKVHLDGHEVPAGGRYLYAVRDPKAVMVSFHRFFDGSYFEEGAIDLETFVREWVMSGTRSGRYWNHLLSWWPKVGGTDTLAFAYEDMIEDHRSTVARIAAFLGHDPGEPIVDRVVAHSTREFMAIHHRQFDDHLLFEAMHETWGLPPDGSARKVKRSAAQPSALSPELEADLDEIWEREITPLLGFANYAELRSHVTSLKSQGSGLGRET